MSDYEIWLGQQGFPPKELKCRNGFIFWLYMNTKTYYNLLSCLGMKSNEGLETAIIHWIKEGDIKIEIDETDLIFALTYRNTKFAGKIVLDYRNQHSVILY